MLTSLRRVAALEKNRIGRSLTTNPRLPGYPGTR